MLHGRGFETGGFTTWGSTAWQACVEQSPVAPGQRTVGKANKPQPCCMISTHAWPTYRHLVGALDPCMLDTAAVRLEGSLGSDFLHPLILRPIVFRLQSAHLDMQSLRPAVVPRRRAPTPSGRANAALTCCRLCDAVCSCVCQSLRCFLGQHGIS